MLFFFAMQWLVIVWSAFDNGELKLKAFEAYFSVFTQIPATAKRDTSALQRHAEDRRMFALRCTVVLPWYAFPKHTKRHVTGHGATNISRSNNAMPLSSRMLAIRKWSG